MRKIIFSSFLFLTGSIVFSLPVQAKDIKLAVIPFQNISQEKKYDWIGQGFSETLISSFANTKNTKVVERLLMNNILKEISFQNSGLIDSNDAVKLGKLTGSNVIVSGSYQILGDEISINARFIDLEKGTVDNGSAFHTRGEITNLFDLQEKVANELNQQFNLNLSSEDKQNIKDITHSTDSIKASQLYVLAKNRFLNGGYRGVEETIKLTEDCLKADPNYSLAYALMGEAYTKYARFSQKLKEKLALNADIDGSYLKGIKSLEKAISISPNIYENYREIGIGYYYMGKHGKEAKYYLNKALSLKPDDVETLVFMGAEEDEHYYEYIMKAEKSDPYNYLVYENLGSYYLNYTKNTPENINMAIQSLNKAIKLNPYSWISDLFIVEAYTRLNQLDNALLWAERLVQMEDKDPISYFAVMELYSRKKDFKKLEEYAEKADKLIDSTFIKGLIVYSLIRQNNYNEAYKLTRKLLESNPQSGDYNFVMALIYKNYYNDCRLSLYHMDIAKKNIKNMSNLFLDNLDDLSNQLKTTCN